MTYCKKCSQRIGDFGDPHQCIADELNRKMQPSIPSVWGDPPKITRQAVKCDMCGSTTIDHTEMQCQINRTLKSLPNQKKGDKSI